MFIDRKLGARLDAQNREYFAGAAEVIRRLSLVEGEPFLQTETSIAMFAGEGSPITQGNGAFTSDDLDEIDRFYRGRATGWEAVLNSFCEPEAIDRLVERGAKAMGWESKLIRSLTDTLPTTAAPPEIEIEEVDEKIKNIWIEVVTQGFFGDKRNAMADLLGQIMANTTSARRYLARWNGEPAGAATVTFGQGLAFLGGMATLPEFRGRGIQTAMILRRLSDSKEVADIAVYGAVPGSSSHRNAERFGFRVAYSELSMRVPVR